MVRRGAHPFYYLLIASVNSPLGLPPADDAPFYYLLIASPIYLTPAQLAPTGSFLLSLDCFGRRDRGPGQLRAADFLLFLDCFHVYDEKERAVGHVNFLLSLDCFRRGRGGALGGAPAGRFLLSLDCFGSSYPILSSVASLSTIS